MTEKYSKYLDKISSIEEVVSEFHKAMMQQNYTLKESETSPETPEVSVIFIARNEDEWLRKSLESLFNTQNETTFETIVFDDLSTDGSTKGIQVDRFLQATTHPVGPSRARNFGALHSRGKYLIFCDAHLKFKDHWIDDLIAPIKDGRCEAVNPIISDIAYPFEKGYGWEFDAKRYNFRWCDPQNCFDYRYLLAGGCVAIDREVFFNVGMFDPQFIKWGLEDMELGIRLILSGYRIGFEPKVEVGHFFKEFNDYGNDNSIWHYNYFRMAYVNMEKEDLDYVYAYAKIPEDLKEGLLKFVMETSQERKEFCESIRKISFSDYRRDYVIYDQEVQFVY